MFLQYLEEFADEGLGPEQFIERLTGRAQTDYPLNFLEGTGTGFLCESYVHTIGASKILLERFQKKCVQLEEKLQDEKGEQRQQLESLEDRQYVSTILEYRYLHGNDVILCTYYIRLPSGFFVNWMRRSI